MALLLDLVLGKHAIRTYSRDELKVFFTLHVSPSSPAPSTSIVAVSSGPSNLRKGDVPVSPALLPIGYDSLKSREVRMLTRVLDMERRKVGHIMTPLNKVMSVALNSPVDSRLLKRMYVVTSPYCWVISTAELRVSSHSASSSFSRLPVHEVGDTHAFRGMLLVTTVSHNVFRTHNPC